jgi:hypothetical protein
VVLADAPLLTGTNLPADLAALADIQGISMTHENWHEAFGKLLTAVRSALAPRASISA